MSMIFFPRVIHYGGCGFQVGVLNWVVLLGFSVDEVCGMGPSGLGLSG